MAMPNRGYLVNNSYRYGFNGKENDNEVKGEGNQQDYGFRIYDPRTGRFLSVDPLTKSYPELTPYQFSSNSPIQNIDLDGLEGSDYQGRITNATPEERDGAPVWAFFRDLSADLINNLTPAGVIDNVVATWKGASTKEKVYKVYEVLTAPSFGRGKPNSGKVQGVKAVPTGATPIKPVLTKPTKATAATSTGKQAVVSNNGNPGAATANNKANASVDPTKYRVKLRKDVIEEIKANAPKTDDGKFIDPNIQKPIEGPFDIGHKTGNEWITRKEMHQKKGSTREQVIKEENDPSLYQIEDRSSNRSHKYEKKKTTKQ